MKKAISIFMILFVVLLGVISEANASTTEVYKLFDATSATKSQGGDYYFGQKTLNINLNPGDTALIASTSDGTGYWIVDNRLFINNSNVCPISPHTDTKECFTARTDGNNYLGQPIGLTLTPIQPLDVTSYIIAGDNTFKLFDYGTSIYGNTEVYLVITRATIDVAIDIKPGSDPSCFNSNEHGVIPVAIFGSADLDVKEIKVDTVNLDGAAVAVRGKADKSLSAYEDVNGDGYMDLVVKIEDMGGYEPGDSLATVTGFLIDGTPIEGTGDICITQ